MKNLAKQYNPKDFEKEIYDKWLQGDYFKAKLNQDKESFSIVLPPPNITGQLHMGHALDHTLQDILIRYRRMQGYDTLWQPGTDHASIATEVKVVKKIKDDLGKTKEEIGREEFLKHAYAWKEEYGGRIVSQMKKLGDSCDWSRERFTMDKGCNDAVLEFFVRLYNEGYIYRGNRIINWCPDCKTSLSDAEVDHEEELGHFYNLKYKVKDEDRYIEIATTRPETMFGDTAVAVNPEDDRYKDLIGKNVILPIVNKPIPIIGDEHADMEYGTGAVKITPCHDPNDFEVGSRHNLEQVLVIDEDGKMNENALGYEGLDRYECRKKLVKDLKDMGVLVSIKEHTHSVGHCYRCNTVVEPITSKQWFVKMKELAKPAIDVLKNGEMKIYPSRFDKIYLNWLENIRDWCISRQLWWGHQIPAYYCQDCNHTMVVKEKPEKCDKCGSNNIVQDEDVLDTWFSSALWPLSTLGWPNDTEELNHYFPTDVLVTGYDIIFFWVIRMVFSSLYIKKEVPFKSVLIHGLVRDSQGRKMSKSLGNGIDPLQVIDEYGADALRFTLASGNSPGNDMRYYDERVIASRNFANKIWNSARFMLMNLEEEDFSIKFDDVKDHLETSDKWILKSLNDVVVNMLENMEKFEIGLASEKIYEFTWNMYCDWYIELIKKRLYIEKKTESKKAALYTGLYVLKAILKLLHPFMPFVTEEIWGYLHEEKMIIVSEFPKPEERFNYDKESYKMEYIIDAIIKIRNLRQEYEVEPSRKIKIIVSSEDSKIINIFEETKEYFVSVSGVSEVQFSKEEDVDKNSVSIVLENAKIFMESSELIDYEKEIERKTKEKDTIISEIKRAEGKLNNENFVKKAPEKIVNEEKEKVEKYEKLLEEVENDIENLKKMKK